MKNLLGCLMLISSGGLFAMSGAGAPAGGTDFTGDKPYNLVLIEQKILMPGQSYRDLLHMNLATKISKFIFLELKSSPQALAREAMVYADDLDTNVLKIYMDEGLSPDTASMVERRVEDDYKKLSFLAKKLSTKDRFRAQCIKEYKEYLLADMIRRIKENLKEIELPKILAAVDGRDFNSKISNLEVIRDKLQQAAFQVGMYKSKLGLQVKK